MMLMAATLGKLPDSHWSNTSMDKSRVSDVNKKIAVLSSRMDRMNNSSSRRVLTGRVRGRCRRRRG